MDTLILTSTSIHSIYDIFDTIKIFSCEFNDYSSIAHRFTYYPVSLAAHNRKKELPPFLGQTILDISIKSPYTLHRNTIEYLKATNRKSIWHWPGAESRGWWKPAPVSHRMGLGAKERTPLRG
jgi:hypothetical protein